MGKPTAKDSEKVMEALKMVNALDTAQRYFNELSDGEKQKTLLARALAQEPQLIVLDEPTSHLDARHRVEVMLILRQLTREKGITVIASLHDIDLAMKACDVALLIKDEHILACGTPEDVLKEDLVTELYGLDKATFSGYLGGVELTANPGGIPVFVIAGAGTGAGVYRALTKHGFTIYTGILLENDIDYHIARSIQATVVKNRAFSEISPDAFLEAQRLMENTEKVIDTGFPVGIINQPNIELLRWALDKSKSVHTLRGKDESASLLGSSASRLIYSHDFFELMSAVKRIK